MAYKVVENIAGPLETDKAPALVINIDGPTVDLPDSTFVRDANLSRDGQNLVLEGPHGEITIEGYFAQTAPPALTAPDGSTLTPDLVQSFLKTPSQFAQATPISVSDVSPVGAVKEISGEATVTRTNGKVENLGVGSPIYQGDIIETSEEGAVNIIFIDESTFAVSNDARMAIDEYVFDPATQGGVSNFSVLKGVFVFTSGLIGREDPDDVEIQTPAGSIGIRGTIIVGNVDTGEITVVEGAIVLEDHAGHTVTLASEFETAIFHPGENKIELVGQLSAHDVSDRYSAIANVTSGLFSTIQENTDGQNTPQQDKTDDKESFNDLNLFSDDIITTTSGGQGLAAQLVAQQFESRPVNGLSQQQGFTLAPHTAENQATTPPFGVLVEKFSFAENDTTGVAVARLSAQFVNFADINLFGLSSNYFNIVRETSTSFLVSLKPGISMNFEDAFKLQYVATDAKGNMFTDFSSLNVTNINEPTILTNAEPNNIGASNFFAASFDNLWSYNFSKSFADPDGDIVTYTVVSPPVSAGIASYNFNSSTGVMDIQFNNLVDGSNHTFTVEARNASNTVLNSVTINFDTIIQNNFTGIMVLNNETFSSSGSVNNTVVIASNSNNVFSDGGNDSISVTGNNNNIMAGDGDDTITLVSGNSNFFHGGAGADTFILPIMQDTKAFGGDGSDYFRLTTTAAVSHLQTFTSGLIIDGGDDNFTALGNPGDVLRLDTLAGNIDFSLIDNGIIKNIETINTDNLAATIINLDYDSVVAMTDADNSLYINMDSLDTLNFTNSSGNTFYQNGTTTNSGQTYNVYTDGVITLMVDTQAATVTGL